MPLFAHSMKMVGLRSLSMLIARRAGSCCGFAGAEGGIVGTCEAEDVAASGYDGFVFEPVATAQVVAA